MIIQSIVLFQQRIHIIDRHAEQEREIQYTHNRLYTDIEIQKNTQTNHKISLSCAIMLF